MTITALKPHRETVEFDHNVLADLCDAYGTEAEGFISRVLGHVEAELTLANSHFVSGQFDRLARSCDDLISLARTVGMRTLDTCATAILERLEAGETAGLPACMARMVRLGDPDGIHTWQVRQDTVA